MKSLHTEVWGTTIEVNFCQQMRRDELMARMPPTWEIRDGKAKQPDLRFEISFGSSGLRLALNDEVFDCASSTMAVVDNLYQTLHLEIAQRAKGVCFVHAATVVKDGAALILPGRSRAGKSTFTQALVSAGWRFYSDEYAIIDERQQVHSYPRPLATRDQCNVRTYTPAEDLGWEAEFSAVPVVWVIETQFSDNTVDTILVEKTPTDCFQALFSNAVAASLETSEVLKLLSALSRKAKFWSGCRGEADSAVSVLEGLLKINSH